MSTDESLHGYHPLPPVLAQETASEDTGNQLMARWRQLTALEQEEIIAGLDGRRITVADAVATVLRQTSTRTENPLDHRERPLSGEADADDPPASFLAYMQAHFPSGTAIQDPVSAARGIWRAAMDARRAGF